MQISLPCPLQKVASKPFLIPVAELTAPTNHRGTTCTTDKIKENYFVSFSTVCRKSQLKQILRKFHDKKSKQVRMVRHAPQMEFVK